MNILTRTAAILSERVLKSPKSHLGIFDALQIVCVSSLLPTGELYDQIQRKQRLPVPEAQFYAAEIVLILIYLRSEQVTCMLLVAILQCPSVRRCCKEAGGYLSILGLSSMCVLALFYEWDTLGIGPYLDAASLPPNAQ